MKLKLRQWLPLTILVLAIIAFFAFGLHRYLTFEHLKAYRFKLLQWTQEHYFLTVAAYILAYILVVTLSVPGAVYMTLIGGFLFGIVLGTLYVVMSATIGATLLFLIVRTAFGHWLAKGVGHWTQKMAHGFRENAFSYLLFLRFIPLFPFWVVNIVPALLNVRLITFVIGTFIGIIPGSLIYVSIGQSLNSLFARNVKPNLGIIFEPQILLPLLGLAIISLLPILYKYFKSRKH